MSHNPAESSTTTKFPINWEIDDVVAQVEDLLASRGLAGRFSPIEEEAEDYEAMGRRDDGLKGHYVSLARMNHALRPHVWALVEVVPEGDEHESCAVPLDEVEAPPRCPGRGGTGIVADPFGEVVPGDDLHGLKPGRGGWRRKSPGHVRPGAASCPSSGVVGFDAAAGPFVASARPTAMDQSPTTSAHDGRGAVAEDLHAAPASVNA